MSTRFTIDRSDWPRVSLWIVVGLLASYLWPSIQMLATNYGEPTWGYLIARATGDWTILTERGHFSPVASIIDAALFASIVAVGQWLILRNRFSAAGFWGVVTFFGLILASLSSRWMYEAFPKEQIFLDPEHTTFTYRPTLGYEVLRSILTSLVLALMQYAVLWKRVAYAHWWPVSQVVAGAVVVFAPAVMNPAIAVIIDAYVLFLLLRRQAAPQAAPLATEGTKPVHPYRWGVVLIIAGVLIKLIGLLVAHMIMDKSYSSEGLLGMYQQSRDSGYAVNAQATSDVLLAVCVLAGIILLVRGYRSTHRNPHPLK